MIVYSIRPNLQVVSVSLDLDGRHSPGLSIVGGLEAGGSGLVDSKGVSERRVGGVQDDGSVEVFYAN